MEGDHCFDFSYLFAFDYGEDHFYRSHGALGVNYGDAVTGVFEGEDEGCTVLVCYDTDDLQAQGHLFFEIHTQHGAAGEAGSPADITHPVIQVLHYLADDNKPDEYLYKAK